MSGTKETWGDPDLLDAVDLAYEGFAARVDGYSNNVAEREDVMCRQGCSGCCQAGLSVSAVEAARIQKAVGGLKDRTRRRLRLRLTELDAGDARCVFLADDVCLIYKARPMVCRTQGLPLAYAAGTIPVERLSAKAQDGRDLTWCPLNFVSVPPRADEIVDAVRVDEGVATLNAAFASAGGTDAKIRTTLAALALEGVSPADLPK